MEEWNQLDEKSFEIRTDLAVEAKDMYVSRQTKKESEIPGVNIQERKEGRIRITEVEVDEVGAEHIGKKKGSYRTIYSDAIKEQDTNYIEETAKIFAKELLGLLEKNNVSNYCSRWDH